MILSLLFFLVAEEKEEGGDGDEVADADHEEVTEGAAGIDVFGREEADDDGGDAADKAEEDGGPHTERFAGDFEGGGATCVFVMEFEA